MLCMTRLGLARRVDSLETVYMIEKKLVRPPGSPYLANLVTLPPEPDLQFLMKTVDDDL